MLRINVHLDLEKQDQYNESIIDYLIKNKYEFHADDLVLIGVNITILCA